MNCLYITLFFNIVASIVQTFIKSWNQLLYPRVIEVCRLPSGRQRSKTAYGSFVRREHQSFLRRIHDTTSSHFADSQRYHKQQQSVCEFPLDVQLLRCEIVWRNAPRIWRDFGSALPIQTRFTQTKPILPLSNEHGSQVKDQGRRQCCHNTHKKFPYRPTRDVPLLSGQASYVWRNIEMRCLPRSTIFFHLIS